MENKDKAKYIIEILRRHAQADRTRKEILAREEILEYAINVFLNKIK